MQEDKKNEPVQSRKSADASTEKDVESTDSAATPPAEGPEEAVDPHVVDWSGPTDPENPKNWSCAKRWSHIILVASLGLATYVPNENCHNLLPNFHLARSTTNTHAM